MATIGRRLLSAIIQSGDVQEMMSLNLHADLFKDSENLLFQFIFNHLNNHGKIPSLETVTEIPGLEDAVVETTEPPGYYMEGVEQRYLQNMLRAFMNEASVFLKDENKDPEKAYEILLSGISNAHRHKNRKFLIDFREAGELIYDEYVTQKTLADEYGIMFGWPSVDDMTGGAKAGDFISFVGRPASGKTFKLLYNALNAWDGQDTSRVPLFVSMEMNKMIIMQRLAAMFAHKPLTHLLKAEMTTKALSQMLDKLAMAKDKTDPFWIVDGNLATTVEDIILLVRQLKPSALYVDGAYLLRHPNQKTSRFERQTENAEWLKQRVAQDLGIPVICSYQFGKDAAKKKKDGSKSKVGLEDIYGSDAIAQLSTMVFGLMQEENVETSVSRDVEILKGRNGETGRFTINWDFKGMNFTEIPKVPKEEQPPLNYCD